MPEITPGLAFLLTRRSRPWQMLSKPVPNAGTLATLLTAAARAPDHGKLEPFRFIVLSEAALRRLAPAARTRAEAEGQDPDKAAKYLEHGHLAVAVVESPKPSDKIPAIEQTYAAACACYGLLNAALAAGWGANWLSGWATHDRTFCKEQLNLEDHERIVGLVFLGTAKEKPPERPRPDIRAKTTWVNA
ncbi:MAG: nitroreductase family protein [Shimia sp.]